jgi:hypothetical protein
MRYGENDKPVRINTLNDLQIIIENIKINIKNKQNFQNLSTCKIINSIKNFTNKNKIDYKK